MAKQMTLRLKVTGLTKGDEQTSLYFGPDYNDERNKEWAKYTPSLSFNMSVLNEVAEDYKVGDTFDATLTLTGKEETDASSGE